jgi:hypothetical protein
MLLGQCIGLVYLALICSIYHLDTLHINWKNHSFAKALYIGLNTLNRIYILYIPLFNFLSSNVPIYAFRIRHYSTVWIPYIHRDLMSRLSSQVFYLWSCIVDTAPPFILWWSNLEILFAPLHRSSPFIGGLRCQSIQTEHGLYIAERTQKAVYIVRCLRFDVILEGVWDYNLRCYVSFCLN